MFLTERASRNRLSERPVTEKKLIFLYFSSFQLKTRFYQDQSECVGHERYRSLPRFQHSSRNETITSGMTSSSDWAANPAIINCWRRRQSCKNTTSIASCGFWGCRWELWGFDAIVTGVLLSCWARFSALAFLDFWTRLTSSRRNFSSSGILRKNRV